MKKLRKPFALFLALCMALSCMTPAFAYSEEDGWNWDYPPDMDGPLRQEITGVEDSYDLNVGQELWLNPSARGEITFESDDESVVTVSWDGKVTAVGAGTAHITVYAGWIYGFIATNRKITINVSYLKQTISGVKSAYTLTAGHTQWLNPQAEGSLSFQSDKPAVATVSWDGTVTAVGAGTAKITITAAAENGYGEAKKVVTVTVKRRKQTLYVDSTSIQQQFNKNESFPLWVWRDGNGALTYKSSDTKVLTVNKNGVCTMKKEGKVKITITAAQTPACEKATKTVTVNLYNGAVRMDSYADSYKKSKFYKALMKLKMSGNKRKDLVAVAKTQVGYREGKNINQMGGTVKGNKNFTEYGRHFGMPDTAWCSMFVTWVARETGVKEEIIPTINSTSGLVSYFKGQKRFYSWAQVKSKKYTPKSGDIIFYSSSPNKGICHMGIVTGGSSAAKKIALKTIEGNLSDQVRSCSYSLSRSGNGKVNGLYVYGVASPNY